MNGPKSGRTDEQSTPKRRAFLAALGVGVAAGVAGCSGLSSQRFEASEVGLPASAQETLYLGELRRDSQTITRTDPTGNVEVTITNHAAVYSRAAGLGGE